jgi:PAS domain S-box-containing protein
VPELHSEAAEGPTVGADSAAAERERERTHSINQRIFETSIDLILVADRQGVIHRVSPSLEDILGYRPEEVAGRSGADFVHPDDLESTRLHMRDGRLTGSTRRFDCRYLHKDGRIVTLAWTGVWSEADQRHFFIGRDMTERLAAEERRRHSQRLESIGQLTGGIAHDFNNLLAIVVGNLELALDQPELGSETKGRVGAAMHAAQRGAELTRQLLAFARQQPLDPYAVDANALVGNITRLLDRTLGQNIEVVFSAGAELWPILIDAANLESAIANLAVNARDAMPDGGRLLIETANATLDAEYAAANPGAAPGEYVAVAVSDTGCGMPPAVANRIFEPFFTTKERGKGTGLGLSTVFGFVKQSGGHIKVYSEVGLGTSVRLYLPRAQAAATVAPAAVAAELGSAVGRSESVLVVEDNDAIRQIALLQLAKLGYRTLEAENGKAALALLDGGERVDLLFTDIVLPGGVSGHMLAREALARRPELKVLYTSGFPGVLLAGEAGLAEGDAILGKPYRLQDLARKLRDVLDV